MTRSLYASILAMSFVSVLPNLALGQEKPKYRTAQEARNANIERNHAALRREEAKLLQLIAEKEGELFDLNPKLEAKTREAKSLHQQGDGRYYQELRAKNRLSSQVYKVKEKLDELRSSLRLTRHLMSTKTGGAVNAFTGFDEDNIKLLGIYQDLCQSG